jgi:hypothetical protein
VEEVQVHQERGQQQRQQQRESSNGVHRASGGDEVAALSSGSNWVGKDVAFMRSNDHSRDRRGRWDTAGLTGVALHLVKGDERSGR